MIKLKSLLEAKRNTSNSESYNRDDILLYGLMAYLTADERYISTQTAKELGEPSTAEYAKMMMADDSLIRLGIKSKATAMLNDLKKWMENKNFIDEMRKNPSMETYYATLEVIKKSPTISSKFFGYAVSMISLYAREEKTSELAKNTKSTYVGEINKELTTRVIFKSFKDINTAYGHSILVHMEDLNGNIIVWFAKPNEIDYRMRESKDKNKSLYIGATVVKHEISKYSKVPETTVKNLRFASDEVLGLSDK